MGETEDAGQSPDRGDGPSEWPSDSKDPDRNSCGFDLDADRLREECGIFGILAIPPPPPSPLLDCMPCNIAARRRRASSLSMAKDIIPSAGLVSSATISRRLRRSNACPANRPSAMCVIRRRARPFCAMFSRFSPSLMRAVSRSRIMATSPMDWPCAATLCKAARSINRPPTRKLSFILSRAAGARRSPIDSSKPCG